jgi:hypothetical protein
LAPDGGRHREFDHAQIAACAYKLDSIGDADNADITAHQADSRTILVVVEATRFAGVKPVFPSAFKQDHVAGIHVRRDPLQDAESKVSRITFYEEGHFLRGPTQPLPHPSVREIARKMEREWIRHKLQSPWCAYRVTRHMTSPNVGGHQF